MRMLGYICGNKNFKTTKPDINNKLICHKYVQYIIALTNKVHIK